MGYTHYWYRTKKQFDAKTFAQFSEDCAKICKAAEIPLASWDGTGEPEFTPTLVAFNGREDCGHRERDLGITWPASERGQTQWFAGAMLEQRSCGGNCSHESFRVEADIGNDPQVTEDGYFDCTKTAYKPYDVLVTGCLIVLDHYFPHETKISSDGESKDWEDARRLCQHVLGYGEDFRLREEG